MRRHAGVHALAIRVPETERTNDYFRERHPEIVADLDARLRALGSLPESGETTPFDAAMARYLGDPFRGTTRRRALARGETALDLEVDAASFALDAAGIHPDTVDAAIVSSFLPDQVGIGNAVFLAKRLGLRGAAWNLETACSSSVVALETACTLVESGRYERVLVVASCTYSRSVDESNPLGWLVGDGAAAILVAPVPDGFGLLGSKSVHTASTCGAFFYELSLDGEGEPVVRMGGSREAGRLIRDASETCLRTCCDGALSAAGLELADIDFFVFNTPMAWFVDFASRVLGFDSRRTIDTYPYVANAGPALMPTNLFLAAKRGSIRPGDRVLLYSMGGVSSAAALVLRWSETHLGPAVEGW